MKFHFFRDYFKKIEFFVVIVLKRKNYGIYFPTEHFNLYWKYFNFHRN